MMMLARRDREWFLAAFADHINGCNLSSPGVPMSQREKFHEWNGIWVQSHADVEDLELFEELYVRVDGERLRVYPWTGWKRGTSDPLLVCLMDLGTVSSGSPGEAERRVQSLVQQGWDYKAREGALRAVHVDDLEKIPLRRNP
ncbi:MAG: hypothetical protein HND58_12945 [Planctomycetota bacterium]|nr:MAG: hypothetical protein HND58_12945 [Planctomycetota bacterium]